MALARSVLLGTAAALATGGMLATPASASPVDAAPSEGAATSASPTTSGDVDASTVTKHVWRHAPSFYWFDGRAGTLYAGNNYFYCQAKGSTHTVGDYKNNWWLKTDDDNGNTNVWVNAVNISGGDNYEPIAGVPRC